MDYNISNITNRTVDQLRTMISQRNLGPGDRFGTEGELVQQLNVSRSIMREAVSRLRAMGILESRQSVGLIVGNPDPIFLFEQAFECGVFDSIGFQELGELRYSLEIGAVKLAVQRATDEQIASLKQLANQFLEAVKSHSIACSVDEMETDFHTLILKSTQNNMLIRMHSVIGAYFLRCNQEFPGNGHGTDDFSAWEHIAIARAFEDRDIERAQMLLVGHLSILISKRSK